MRGECISHEIDILLEKEGRREIVEVKFHNQTFGKSDVQVALYTYARFLDVQKPNNIDAVWVATNTKLSTDAITYSECKGIKMLAWNYPQEDNLQDFVERPKMYPITILTDITTEEKRRFVDNNIVMASDLLKISRSDLVEKFLIEERRVDEIVEGARLIANGQH